MLTSTQQTMSMTLNDLGYSEETPSTPRFQQQIYNKKIMKRNTSNVASTPSSDIKRTASIGSNDSATIVESLDSVKFEDKIEEARRNSLKSKMILLQFMRSKK